MQFGTVKFHGHSLPTFSLWVVILFDEAFKCGDGVKFLGYVGTDAVTLCIEFCNSVRCHIFYYTSVK
jgi:hypothetical protein